ncbi:putative transposase, partial [Legionella sainthelensi]
KLIQIFKTLVQEPDLEWEFIDGSIVKAHEHSAGAPNKEEQALVSRLLEIQRRFIWPLMLTDYLLILK